LRIELLWNSFAIADRRRLHFRLKRAKFCNCKQGTHQKSHQKLGEPSFAIIFVDFIDFIDFKKLEELGLNKIERAVSLKMGDRL
jgi:hypothetical protein